MGRENSKETKKAFWTNKPHKKNLQNMDKGHSFLKICLPISYTRKKNKN
jgi:hypothetical protein